MDNSKLLDMTITIGYYMLEYGGEIYRVEESIKRVACAYNAKSVEVFAIPSSIVVTIVPQQGTPLTQTKRIYNRVNDLDKIDHLNNLCRNICSQKPDLEEINAKLNAILQRPKYRFQTQVMAFALISFAFTLFFQGTLRDAVVAACIGVIIKLVLYQLERFESSAFINNIVAGCITATIAVFMVRYHWADNTPIIIIGTLMNLVPGMALTNSARDFIAGDFIAGLMKMTEALLIATGIAIGVAIPLSFLF